MESGASIDVNGYKVTGENSIIGQPGPTTCDMTAVLLASPAYICPPPPPTGGGGGGGCSPCTFSATKHAKGSDSLCCNPSPIIIDVSGHGYLLTDAKNGVAFDIAGTNNPIQMGWTASGADDAFLALPGADGLVHSGKELFGNFTPQPASANPNGFAALAVYDDPKNGGNGDGLIDAEDAAFSSLRLWIDANHDGISQLEELHTLPSLGVYSISLNYQADERTDQYGNVFRYRAQVNPGDPANVGRTAYDVFFVLPDPPTARNMPVDPQQKCVVPAKAVPSKTGLLN